MDTPLIHVCGLHDMPRQVGRLRPERLISLLPAAEQPLTPPTIAPSDHLRVMIRDFDDPREGEGAPTRRHVEALIEFLRATPPGASILIHCLAGVSRSPAAALIALVLDAPGCELEAALLLSEAAPFAWPNRLLLELADDLLDRGGALLAAREAMGRPDWLAPSAPFTVPRSFAAP